MHPQICLSSAHLRQDLCFFESQNILYLNNAKAGCSTIKQALIRAMGRIDGFDLPDTLNPFIVHGQGKFWSLAYNHIRPGRTKTFSLVRNPYLRVLSAYLDKVAKPGILRSQFAFQHGLDPREEIGFEQFLSIVQSGDELHDQHWRPQVANLFVDQIDITRVYYLENFRDTAADLAAFLDVDIEFRFRGPHTTHASEKLSQYLTPTCRGLIEEIYEADFRTFGYSTDPEKAGAAPARSVAVPMSVANGHRILAIAGFLSSENPSRVRQLTSKKPFTFAEKAMIAAHPFAKPLFPMDAFAAEVDDKARNGSLSERYIANQFISQFQKPRPAPEAIVAALQEQIRLAPYFIGARIQLVSLLIKTGKTEEAERELDLLGQTTWQKEKVKGLRKRLADRVSGTGDSR